MAQLASLAIDVLLVAPCCLSLPSVSLDVTFFTICEQLLLRLTRCLLASLRCRLACAVAG
jgi:hypothetical protein